MDAHSGRDLGARAQSDRSPTAAPKWQPARDFGDRHIMAVADHQPGFTNAPAVQREARSIPL